MSDTQEISIKITDDSTPHDKDKEQITNDFTPHNKKKIAYVACSPKMEYVATWSIEDLSAVGWCINNNQLKHEYMIPKEKRDYDNNFKIYIDDYDDYLRYDKNFFTVSDNKFVTVFIGGWKMDAKPLFLNLPYFEMPYSEITVKFLAFLDGGDFIMITKKPTYRIYIFTQENNELIHKSAIKIESYDENNEEMFLSNGKLFMYDKNIGNITKWDIKTLSFEAHFLFDNSFDVKDIKLSDNEVLLFVYGTKTEKQLKEEPYPCVSVYSANSGIKFTTYEYEKTDDIDAVYLIASNIGARLLIVSHKQIKDEDKEDYPYEYKICDPFTNTRCVNSKKLIVDFEVSAKEVKVFEINYIIKFDKIDLNDIDSIFILSDIEKIINLIKNSPDEAAKLIEEIDNSKKEETFSKYLVTWILEYVNDAEKIILTAKSNKDDEKLDSIQIVPKLYIDFGYKDWRYVIGCDCLDNDDLAMVTIMGVFIWTVSAKDKKIELSHYWDDNGSSWYWDRQKENSDKKNIEKNSEKENIVKEKIKQLDEYIKELEKKSFKKPYFFPPSTYSSMIYYDSVFLQADSKKKVFFDELIEKHINNKFCLFLYGKNLIKVIIKEDQDMLLRKFCDGCINLIEKNDEVPDMQLFNIISHSIVEIFKKDPAFFADFIMRISLFEIRKLISDINSESWDDTKPIVSKTLKAIKDEKQESEVSEHKIQSKDEKQINQIEDMFIELKD
ncbi:2900_t:CDS:2, partial [Dentiscutata erythropus]